MPKEVPEGYVELEDSEGTFVVRAMIATKVRAGVMSLERARKREVKGEPPTRKSAAQGQTHTPVEEPVGRVVKGMLGSNALDGK
jgi:nitrate reductase alpha subunit